MSKWANVERMVDGSGVRIDFYLNDKKFFSEGACIIPQVGDEIRFNSVVYAVKHRIFFYDEEYPRVALSIKKIKVMK